MSKSPLSGAFAGSSQPAKKNKKNGALLLISGIALATSIGGVFAANSITINSGNAIQFGQGVAETNSCVSALTTAVNQAYEATSPAPDPATTEFYVDTVSITGDFSACAVGTDLKVKLLDSSNAALTNASFSVDVIAADGTPTAGTEVKKASAQTVVITPSAQILASSVKKITVTTE
jgi:hypothetical protein